MFRAERFCLGGAKPGLMNFAFGTSQIGNTPRHAFGNCYEFPASPPYDERFSAIFCENTFVDFSPDGDPIFLFPRGPVMKKLPAVEDARAIMTQGLEWGVWKWLMEKKRVRAIADEARAALGDLEMKVKLTWSDDLKIAYNQLVSENGDAKSARRKAKAAKPPAESNIDAKILAAVRGVKQADDDAYNAHEDAEDVFAEAEKKMSTSMAREGARKALVAYDLHEAAIRKAEALARGK